MEVKRLGIFKRVQAEPEKENVEKKEPPKSNPIKNNQAMIGAALVGLSVLATAGLMIHKGNIGKLKDVLNGAAEEVKTITLKDIDFNKGVATLKKNGDKFTGTISDVLKSGNAIELKYKDGVLQESYNFGDSVRKIYETTAQGKQKVTILADGSTKTVIVDDIKDAVIKKQQQFKDLISNKGASVDDLIGFDRTNLSAKQKAEIDSMIAFKKQEAIDKAKMALEESIKKFRSQFQMSKDCTFDELNETQIKLSAIVYGRDDANALTPELKEESKKMLDEIRRTIQVKTHEMNSRILDDPEKMKIIDDIFATTEVYEKGGGLLGDAQSVLKNNIVGEYSPDGMLCHGTTKESAELIKKGGFDIFKGKQFDSGRGVYLSDMSGAQKYSGESGEILKYALKDGKKIAIMNQLPDGYSVYSEISEYSHVPYKLYEAFKGDGIESGCALAQDYMTRKLMNMGYSGIDTASITAHCGYYTIFNPEDLILMK